MRLLRHTLDERLANLVGELPQPRRLVRRGRLPKTRAQLVQTVEKHRALRETRRAAGLCVCSAPLAVRDGTVMKQCEGCISDRAVPRATSPRTCGCAPRGPHGTMCRDRRARAA